MNLRDDSSNNCKEIGIGVKNNSLLNIYEMLGQIGGIIDNLFTKPLFLK
jgi:hypothetical protein